MATIKDIAKYAGVSCTTVSNVIHNRAGRVSKETIDKIHDAINKFNYIPNMTARSLVNSSSKVIAMINHAITRKDINFMADPFQSSLIGIIESVLREHDYFLMVRTIDTIEELLAFLRNWNIDGLFITGIFQDNFFDALLNLEKPAVFIDSYIENSKFCNVGLQDYEGGYLAAEYLINHGHRHIAFASPTKKSGGVLHQRFLGYKAALTAHHMPFDPSLVYEYEMDLGSCRRLSEELAKKKELTAVMTSADIMAAGIMTGLREQGIGVPDDISVIGFDDIPVCRMLTPALTTVHQDITQKGIEAVNLMLKKLQNEEIGSTKIILPVSLVERSSVRQI